MSDLKIALIILGALIIAGVLVYNWLQERKLRDEVSREFIVPQKDVLADDFYIDTDAYVEKELGGVSDKMRAVAHPVSVKKTNEEAIAEPVIAVLDDSVLNEATIQAVVKTLIPNKTSLNEPAENAFLSSTDMQTQLQQESIVKADLLPKTQGIQANLPTVIHPQIDLTAILYATKSIGVNEMQALKTTIARSEDVV